MNRLFAMILLILILTAAFWTANAEGKECWYYAEHGTHDYEQTDAGYATCTEDGYYVIECRQCGYYHREITEYAVGHSFVQTELKYVNCTDDGYFVGTCTKCGYKEKEITHTANRAFSQIKLRGLVRRPGVLLRNLELGIHKICSDTSC